MIFPRKINPDTIIPAFLPPLEVTLSPFNRNKITDAFNIFGKQFSQMATVTDYQALKKHFIEVDISEELSLLNGDGSLEVTIPVLGTCDLLGAKPYSKSAQQFAAVLAINGYGVGNADYVLITDIVGNQYEVLVSQDGKIELPADGTGLFSLISFITFIYDADKIKQGTGLTDLTHAGARKNTLVLLPPPETSEKFDFKTCVSHLTDKNLRIVDAIRSVSVIFQEARFVDEENITIKREGATGALTIELALMLLIPFTTKPLMASVTLEAIKGVEYTFHPPGASPMLDTHGWMQHSVYSNVYTKPMGMSEQARALVVKNIYSQYDLMKDYLQNDDFSLSQEKGYNDFLLRPEAFEKFYDIFLHDLVHHKMDGSFLFDRVPEDRLADLDLPYPLDFHDSAVLDQIQSQAQDGNYDNLKDLFLSGSGGEKLEVKDHFEVYALGLEDRIPSAQLEVSYDMRSAPHLTFYEENLGILTDVIFPQTTDVYHTATNSLIGYFEDHFHLSLQQNSSPIDLHDLLDFPVVDRTVIDLEVMLKPLAGWQSAPHFESSDESKVNITVWEEGRDQITIVTSAHFYPLTYVDIDPSHIHTSV